MPRKLKDLPPSPADAEATSILEGADRDWLTHPQAEVALDGLARATTGQKLPSGEVATQPAPEVGRQV